MTSDDPARDLPARPETELDGQTRRLPTAGAAPRPHRLVPMRYAVRDDEDGPYLVCTEAANIEVRIQRGHTVSASAARRAAEGTIFLDGVAQAEPFLDVERRVYNLDHHEGCVRVFTLAACEQAMVLVLKGLDLATDQWLVLANDPDLDAVLAIWVLLNHRRLQREGSQVRARMHPVVRLQGVIDGHGLEHQELTAFPEALRAETLSVINSLRTRELELKRSGAWHESDFLEYALEILHAVDSFAYSPRDFDEVCHVEELERASIGADRFAVVCRSDAGIYEVEQQLVRSHGDRVGIIVLQKDPETYTLRQVDPFLRRDLSGLYDRLNLVDRRARGDDRWGGSSEIGGSPRTAGTALDPRSIAAVCRWVYRPPSLARRAATAAVALVAAAAFLGCCLLVAGGGYIRLEAGPLLAPLPTSRLLLVVALVAVGAGLALVVVGSRQPGLYGLRMPRGRGWLVAAPAALAVAIGGGPWIPSQALPDAAGLLRSMAIVGAAAIGCELLFRGVVEGLMVEQFPAIRSRGRLFWSTPLALSTLASGAATIGLFHPVPIAAWSAAGDWRLLPFAVAVLLFHLALGFSRERSESLLAPVLLHLAVAEAVVVAVGLQS